MPKRSSRSDKAISPSTEVMRQPIGKRIIVAVLLIALGVGLYAYLHPRRLTIESVAPDNAIMFVRLDHVEGHLKSLRSSQFWKGFANGKTAGTVYPSI